VNSVPDDEIHRIYFSFGDQYVMCNFTRLWLCGWAM